MRSLVPGRDFQSSFNSGSHKKVCGCFSDSQWRHGILLCFVYRLCRVPEIKSYILSWEHSVFGRKFFFFSGGLSLEAIYQSSGSSFRACFVKTAKDVKQPFWNHSIAALSQNSLPVSLYRRRRMDLFAEEPLRNFGNLWWHPRKKDNVFELFCMSGESYQRRFMSLLLLPLVYVWRQSRVPFNTRYWQCLQSFPLSIFLHSYHCQ